MSGLLPARAVVAPYAETRREAVSRAFPGERVVVPAGSLKVRSNDCDYVFRPHSAFSHLTGLGADREPDATLWTSQQDDRVPSGVDPGAQIEPGAQVHAPSFVGAGAIVRSGATVGVTIVAVPTANPGPSR